MQEACALALTSFDQIAEDWKVVKGELDGLPLGIVSFDQIAEDWTDVEGELDKVRLDSNESSTE
jgi:hypothetical protein